MLDLLFKDKKHLKNVGPIHHCKPPHAIHQVSLAVLLHAACASMSMTTTTTHDRGDRYGPMEWAQRLPNKLAAATSLAAL